MNLFFAFFLTAFSLNAENTNVLSGSAASADCEDDCDECVDCPCQLDGAYSYEVSGKIGATSADTPYQETGVITFDCATRTGCITALAVENGTTPFQSVTYDFNYIIVSPGLLRLTLTRNQGSSAIGGLQWAVSYGQRCDHISLEFLPAPTIPSGERFTFNQVVGTGGK